MCVTHTDAAKICKLHRDHLPLIGYTDISVDVEVCSCDHLHWRKMLSLPVAYDIMIGATVPFLLVWQHHDYRFSPLRIGWAAFTILENGPLRLPIKTRVFGSLYDHKLVTYQCLIGASSFSAKPFSLLCNISRDYV